MTLEAYHTAVFSIGFRSNFLFGFLSSLNFKPVSLRFKAVEQILKVFVFLLKSWSRYHFANCYFSNSAVYFLSSKSESRAGILLSVLLQATGVMS